MSEEYGDQPTYKQPPSVTVRPFGNRARRGDGTVNCAVCLDSGWVERPDPLHPRYTFVEPCPRGCEEGQKSADRGEFSKHAERPGVLF